LGDGETDEPESLGAISLAGRERLDNLIFVVNCNLQRLDGPVRGNGKIIQELESVFRGAGWNVIKVIWGAGWDRLIARDTTGVLAKPVKGYWMGEAGEGQNITHQQKKMAETSLRRFRDRFGLPIPDEQLLEYPLIPLAEGSEELAYLRARREALGGWLPVRRERSTPLPVPDLSAFGAPLAGSGEREIS